jgi:predicted lipoprotein with Yx(FWY)xxD motif
MGSTIFRRPERRSESLGADSEPRTKAMLRRTVVLAVGVLTMSTTAAFASTSVSLGVGTRTVSKKPQTIVVDGRGVTVYALGGESLAHLECVTRKCFNVWQPLRVNSATVKVVKAPGVPGTVGIMHRVSGGFYQVMLNRHPLYYFSGDKGRMGSTAGQGIMSFGGRWHVISAS